METIDQIHQKLETMDLTPFEKRDLKPLVEQAFRAGFTRALEKPDPLAGYSNLTAAISAGDPIDWEYLDGLKTQCVNPTEGTLHGTMERHGRLNLDLPDAWWDGDVTAAYINALYDGWVGKDGWSLWVEGEIPMRRKTANELEVGTYFRGLEIGFTGGDASLMYVGENDYDDLKTVYYAPRMLDSSTPACDWVVLEEYGTFRNPEGK